MKNIYFKLLLFGLLTMLWPTASQAEMLRLAGNNRTELPNTTLHAERTGELHLKKGKKFFHFWERLKPGKKSSKKGKLIAGIVVMLFLTIIFLLIFIGSILISMPMGAAGQSDNWHFPVVSLIFLLPAILFIAGIINNAKKIKKIEEEEAPKN